MLHVLDLGASNLQILLCYWINMVMLDESKKWGPNVNWLFCHKLTTFQDPVFEKRWLGPRKPLWKFWNVLPIYICAKLLNKYACELHMNRQSGTRYAFRFGHWNLRETSFISLKDFSILLNTMEPKSPFVLIAKECHLWDRLSKKFNVVATIGS